MLVEFVPTVEWLVGDNVGLLRTKKEICRMAPSLLLQQMRNEPVGLVLTAALPAGCSILSGRRGGHFTTWKVPLPPFQWAATVIGESVRLVGYAPMGVLPVGGKTPGAKLMCPLVTLLLCQSADITLVGYAPMTVFPAGDQTG